jgi:hypothetical protein
MPIFEKRRRLSDILILNITAPEKPVEKPDFTEDNQCLSGLKVNNFDVWEAYNEIATEAVQQGIPIRVTELQGTGPLKVFTVYINPNITKAQINMLQPIAEKHFTQYKAAHATVATGL